MALSVLIFLAVYLLGELVAHYLIFGLLIPRIIREQPPQPNTSTSSLAQLKGHFERFMLFLGFFTGFPQVVIVFGALKVGTFFSAGKAGTQEKISKDFYLIGNVTSVSLSLLYALASTGLLQIGIEKGWMASWI